ncbi:tetraacyldisaccharide 4'-kinase [Xanthobacter sp. TB0139]|uniref:tetraacyldisaccharide 4'-kinase n=1 Tax=Xanthobacter sp. TB0139 TaxID=3459178 RepID=UPI00403A065B
MRAPSFWWRRGVLSRLLAFPLWPIGALIGRITLRRMKKPGQSVPVPVICIGNPTVGGAGKTPTAIACINHLLHQGAHPFALSRGHGGSARAPLLVESNQHGPERVGDEALLLARHAPTLISGGSNRHAAAQMAQAQGATHIIMDDGFQNPSLVKDVSILVVDSVVGVGNNHILPAGPLRAPLAPQLEQADAVLLIGLKGMEEGEPGYDVAQLARQHGCAVLRGHLEADPATVTALQGMKLHAFAGIGRPEKFFNTLRRVGLDVASTRAFPDHHPFTPEEVEVMVQNAARQRALLVTTEKDMARLSGQTFRLLRQRIACLPVHLVLDDPAELDTLLETAAQRAAARMAVSASRAAS